MADALIPQHLGKRYQAWLFWEQAARLLLPETHVVEVRFEEGVRAFDDVVVRYDPLHTSAYGVQIGQSSYQGKYHVASGGAFSLAALTDPSFIGAKTATLLQRLGEAYRTLGPDDFLRGDYWLVSPWPLDPADKALAAVWRENSESLSTDVLRQGKHTSSQWVNLRAKWREATEAESDDELLAMVSRLRLSHGHGGVSQRSAEILSDRLRLVGLRPIDPHAAVEPYGDIPWNLHANGVTRYTRGDVERIADENNLRIPAPPQPQGPRLGIRTRVEWGDHMDTQCRAVLPLEDLFCRRWLEPGASWAGVYQRVHDFLRTESRDGVRRLLEIAGPISVAVAAGYALPSRDGRPIFPLQRRRGGIDLWEAVNPDPTAAGWQVHADEPTGTGGPDVAIGLGLAREVWPAMNAYIKGEVPSVGRVIELQPLGGPSLTAVRDAGHALHLAGEAERYLRALRQQDGAGTAHLFLSVPVAFAFFLGQEGERLGRCQFYEFDFGNERGGSYWPSLLVPDDAAPTPQTKISKR